MEHEKEDIIKNGIEAQKQKFEIRNELVGAGQSTTDFNEIYEATLLRLGLQEPLIPKATVGLKTYIPPEFGGTGIKPLHINNGIRFFKIGMFLSVALILIAVFFLVGQKFIIKTNPENNQPLRWGAERIQDTQKSARLSIGDEILQTKVKATVVSAMMHGSRMGSYDGVCTDISVVAPIVCKQTEDSFLMYVPMSNGTYFCEDKKQQGSIVPSSPAEWAQCP